MHEHNSEGIGPTVYDSLRDDDSDIENQSIAKFTVSKMQRRVKVSWLWEGWMPRGMLTLLVGKPGIGKSALGLAMANIVVTGSPWPDGQSNENQGLVVWVEMEACQAILVDRCEKWQVPMDKLLIPCTTNNIFDKLWLDEHNEADWQELERVARTEGVQLVVVDSLRGAYHGNENDSTAITLLIGLQELARDLDIAVLIIHHLRKRSVFDGTKINLERIRGSSVIGQVPRSVWAIDRPSPIEPETNRVQQIKNNLTRFPEAIGFIIEESGLRWVDAPSEPSRESDKDRVCDLLEALLADGPMLAEQIQKEVRDAGFGTSTLWRAKKALGIISERREGHWKWAMPTLKIGRQVG